MKVQKRKKKKIGNQMIFTIVMMTVIMIERVILKKNENKEWKMRENLNKTLQC
jgi:hypothetical protein